MEQLASCDLPRRFSLPSQTATILRAEINSGRWASRLPGERSMCSDLQVGRNTLRQALTQLQREGLVRSIPGSGCRILGSRPPTNRRSSQCDVGLLSPEPLERLRPVHALWIEELRALVAVQGGRLRVFHGRQYFRTHPDEALKRLVTTYPQTGWVLTLSSAAIQRWFAQNQIGCVIAGSVHEGLNLPYRDLDHRAICGHAVSVLVAQGHRKLALLIAKSDLAGDWESEAGFLEAGQSLCGRGVEAQIRRHDGSASGVSYAVKALMQQPVPPSALIVANPLHYLTAATVLPRLGFMVPGQVSLISRDDDLFLDRICPRPARYRGGRNLLARSLLDALVALRDHRPIAPSGLRLMPEFLAAASLASPKSCSVSDL